MKKIIVILSLLLIPNFAFAVISYTQTPAGFFPTSPVRIQVSFTDPVEACELDCGAGDPPFTQWNIELFGNAPDWDFVASSPLVNCAINSQTYDFILPVGTEVGAISFGCGVVGDGTAIIDTGFEIFEVIEQNNHIISTTTENVNSMLGYVGQIFTDLGVWIWVAIGIPVGFYVVKRVIKLVSLKR